MKIFYSRHALARMRKRKLLAAEVRATIISPDRVITETPHRQRAMRQVVRNSKPYLIIVVYDTIRGNVEVVTVFPTSKIQKYLNP